MKRLINLLIYFCLFVPNTFGQDPIYSLSFENKSTINPSLIGRDGPGKFRSSIFHRNLFRPIRGPLHASDFSIDYSFCNSIFALGLNASNETQGDGFFRTNNLNVILGATSVLGKSWIANGGMQFGIIQQKVDWNEYLFSDELSPIYGAIYRSSNDMTTLVSKISPDVSFGFDLTNFNYGRNGSRNATNFGFALMHLTNNTNTGILNNYVLPRRFTAHLNWIHRKNPKNISKSFQIMGRYDRQLQFNNVLLRCNYSIIEEFTFGIGIRGSYSVIGNINSPIFSANFNPSSNLSINFCVETSFGGANLIGAGNSVEIGIIFRSTNPFCFSNGKFNGLGGGSKNKSRAICPVFNKTKTAPTF
jgi:type IX secretion system PorP/SprF family membrane protein